MLSRPLKNDGNHPLVQSIGVSFLAVCLLFSLPVALLSATEVYSWIDDNGVQHFAGQPPAHDNYQRMTLRDRGGRTVTRPAQPRPAEQNVTQQETVITTPDRTVTVIDPEVIAANCNRARNNIDLVNSRRRIVLTGEDGEPRRLDDNERLALISESQAYIDENCG